MAIKKYCFALKHTGKNIRDNKKIVLEAIKKSGYCLKYASKRLKKDHEVALKALKKCFVYLICS